jgi:hypothetical protein
MEMQRGMEVSSLNRRSFLRLVAGGAAVVGAGVLGNGRQAVAQDDTIAVASAKGMRRFFDSWLRQS